MKKHTWLLVLICLGCKQAAPVATIHISFANNKQSLTITGLNPVILHDIARDSIAAWKSLFPVYRLPADTDMKDYQPIQPGKYQLNDSVLIFTPDTPFINQQAYFLRYYNYAGNKNIWDYIKGNTQVGKLHYRDLVFSLN